MVLKASGNSWVEIEDIDGTILFARLMRPGETYIVPKINGLTINSGNAGFYRCLMEIHSSKIGRSW